MPSRRGWTWVQRRGQELEESRVVMVVEDLIQRAEETDGWGVCHRGDADIMVRGERGGLGGWSPVAVGTRGTGPRRDGRPVGPQRQGWRCRSASPRINAKNPLPERLDPAFAGGARRTPENASLLALTLQIKRSFQRRGSFVVAE